MITVKVVGQDSLAEATRVCCQRHFKSKDKDPDILWAAYDTPIGEEDRPNTNWVITQIKNDVQSISFHTLVLVSSQVPVGTIATLENECPFHTFAYSPENIRVASAIPDFENQSRIVVGRRHERHDFILSQLFAPFTSKLIFTDPETAEMVKHALNCWLGMNIAFINEIARLSAKVGADANVISESLLTERRISPKAPLRPGSPFGGGHLARDIYNLEMIADLTGVSIPIISHILESNAK